jgi:hypothetical protein
VKIEGKGEVAPATLIEQLKWSDLQLFKDFALEVAKRRGYANGHTPWKRGLTAGITLGNGFSIPPHAAGAFVGKVGECALVYLINRRIGKERPVAFLNLDILPNGDGGKDVEVYGRQIEVKTRRGHFKNSLIQRVTSSGKLLNLLAHYYVFCEYNLACPLKVGLLGWARNQILSPLPFSPAKRGDHRNIEVKDPILLPMRSLLLELDSFRKG